MDLEALRVRFMQERTTLQERIAATQGEERRETAEGQTDSAHLWEEADIRDATVDQALARLEAIDAALQRLDLGTFGVCSGCDKPIPEARLEVMPYALTCTDCAEASQ